METYPDYPHLDCSEESGVRVFAVKTTQLLDDVAEKVRRDLVRAYEEPGPKDVVVCLHHVTCVSSCGVSILFSLLRRVNAAGGRMALCGLTPQVANVLHLCQLIEHEDRVGPSVFITEPNASAAVRRLAGQA
jgi:anti-anti-sigma factor